MDTSIYFSGQGIKIAVGNPSESKLSLKTITTIPVERDVMINGVITNDFAVKHMILEAWDKYKLPKSIRIVIDSSSVMLKALTVPSVSEKNLYSIISREYTDSDNFSDLIFDYCVEDPCLEEGGASIISFAAEKSFIGSYVDLFADLKGAKIKSIDVAQNCCIRFMKFNKETAGKTAILAVSDGNILSLLLFVNGKYRFSNRARLFSDPETVDYTDEISNALSFILQFHRSERSSAEISDIYFCNLGEQSQRVINTIGLIFDRQRVMELPVPKECVSGSAGGDKISDYIYCLGNLIR